MQFPWWEKFRRRWQPAERRWGTGPFGRAAKPNSCYPIRKGTSPVTFDNVPTGLYQVSYSVTMDGCETVSVTGQVHGVRKTALHATLRRFGEVVVVAEPAGALVTANGQQLEQPSGHAVGIRVEGKPGFVRSPYRPDAGVIEVRDYATGRPYARGTVIKCPFTGRVFVVP